ncbi:MAG TPA: hypothetical protein VGH80_07410 [Xanthomonadaceae bacterium]
MAIDYALRFPCEVRRNMPEPKLEALVKYLALAKFAAARFKEAHPELEMDGIFDKCKVGVATRRPDGVTEQVPMTIRQLLEMCEPLNPFMGTCKECRANVADRPFGCFAKINYPIPNEAEQWLLSRLPNDAADPALQMLFRFLAEVGVDGAPVDELRKRPNIFQRQLPATRRWGEPSDSKKITSSQIIQMLAFGGEIKPAQAYLYTQMLRLERVLSDPHPPSNVIEQFKTLMCAIVMAGRLEADISIDA